MKYGKNILSTRFTVFILLIFIFKNHKKQKQKQNSKNKKIKKENKQQKQKQKRERGRRLPFVFCMHFLQLFWKSKLIKIQYRMIVSLTRNKISNHQVKKSLKRMKIKLPT